ncbi:MAG: phosphoribosylamine--glycine ligase [Candidatus Omnitrophica bacterium]|nr:phosphoribosylamine--glycine ligase [Candidatus Omnitrophota bacterium]
MNILIIGSGAREHALAWKIKQSPLVKKIFCIPGNPGIAGLTHCAPGSTIVECVEGSVENIRALADFAAKQKIDLTVAGPELPLVRGIADEFAARGLKIFGPSRAAARLEGSKIFAKEMMKKYGVPTAGYETFENGDRAKKYVVEAEYPLVIKADGLAAGKGVAIVQTAKEAIAVVDDYFQKKIFGEAGTRVVIEEFLEGPEISVLALTDGETVIPLASAQDHKRAFDGDTGPNTGGMGAYSPYPLLFDKDIQELTQSTITPIISGMKKEGCLFRGILYGGLMLTERGPKVLEYNVRFGDPETEAVLVRLTSDLVPLLLASVEGTLKHQECRWLAKTSMTVVLASLGYPGAFEKDFEITGIDEAEERGARVFHAGTARNASGSLVTNGGRVLAVTALGETLLDARENVYEAVSRISFSGVQYRRDIGHQILGASICS